MLIFDYIFKCILYFKSILCILNDCKIKIKMEKREKHCHHLKPFNLERKNKNALKKLQKRYVPFMQMAPVFASGSLCSEFNIFCNAIPCKRVGMTKSQRRLKITHVTRYRTWQISHINFIRHFKHLDT